MKMLDRPGRTLPPFMQLDQEVLTVIHARLQGAKAACAFGACAGALLLAHGAEIDSTVARFLGGAAILVAGGVVWIERQRAISILATHLDALGTPRASAQRTARKHVLSVLSGKAPIFDEELSLPSKRRERFPSTFRVRG